LHLLPTPPKTLQRHRRYAHSSKCKKSHLTCNAQIAIPVLCWSDAYDTVFVRGGTVVASISGMFYSHVNQALDLTIELKHLLLPTPAAPRVTAVAHAATVLVVTVAATKAIQAVLVQTKSSIGSHTAQMIKVLRHLSLMLCVTLIALCVSAHYRKCHTLRQVSLLS